MASAQLSTLLILSLFLAVFTCNSRAQAQLDSTPGIQVMTDDLEWPSSAMSLHDKFGDSESMNGRRSLFWQTMHHYYISYGALSANRVPCPPRSGRSYYTHNCYAARGPVQPYTRGCSAITLCRR